jgi:hypothetical protein
MKPNTAAMRARGHRAPAPKISVVTMADVPEPATGYRGQWADVYGQIRALKDGAALKLEFSTESHGAYARGRLRALAKADKTHGKVFSSSASHDKLTRYFWLEKA